MPLISVIIPVYNVENYLCRCLDSVINQTFKDLEILCVNDGSKDGSIAILEEYAVKDNRIKIIHKKNGGLSSARNEGLKYATAEYIGFVDSDDWIEPDTYLLAYAAIKETGADLVCYYAQLEFEAIEANMDDIRYHAIKRTGLYSITNDILIDTTVTAWNKLYKKSIIDKFSILFPFGFLHEDVEFFNKYAVMCRNIFYIGAYLYHYVIRKGSIIWNVKRIAKRKNLDWIKIGYNVYSHYNYYSLLSEYLAAFLKLWCDILWNVYFYNDSKYRPYILNYASKTISKMDLPHIEGENGNVLENIKKGKYSNIPFLNVRKNFKCMFLTLLICKSESGSPELLGSFLGFCFRLNLSFALPFVRRLQRWKRSTIKYRLDELCNRMEYTNQRIDSTDRQVQSFNQRVNDAEKHTDQVLGWLNETNKWVENTNQRIDDAVKWVENTNQRIDDTGKQVEYINARAENTAGDIKKSFTVYNRMITDYAKENKQKILSMPLEAVQHSKKYMPRYQNTASYLKAIPYFMFCPNNGNLGDIIIAAAEYQYFNYLGCDYSVFDMYSQALPENGPIDFVYGGGGIFVKYCNYQNVIDILKSPNLRRVIILPSSFFECPDVLEVFDERFTVFCREKRSYDYCKSINTRAEFILSDDMAFNLNIADLKNNFSSNIKRNITSLNDIYLNRVYASYSFYMSIRTKIVQAFSENTIVTNNGIRAAYLLRADAESQDKTSDITAFLQKRIDLSGFTWTSCADPGVVKLLSVLFIDAINTLDVVVTDRLHIGIASAMLGKKVYLLDNIYGKISAVYEHSMKDLKNVYFIESLDGFFEGSMDAPGTNADLSLFETDTTFAGYFSEYCSVDQMNDVITATIFTY
jgi:glycosyltransferase involved in cell wall biosynthesis/exopolysaccharide biosynthesis predicted pyruvyltransferase EpsI